MILYEWYSRWRLEKKVREGRTFVDGIHYVKKGEGRCTVVFVSGTGSSHAIWKEVQEEVAAFAVTIAYDRRGLMFSEGSDDVVTNAAVSEELAMLLARTGCPKPYILVGHSMAGIYLRPFIHTFKKDIAGIVFAEAAHPLLREKASPGVLKLLRYPPEWLIRFVVNSGIYRVLFSFKRMSVEFDMDHPLHRLERDYFYRSYKKVIQELSAEGANFKDAMRYTSFGDIPLTLVMGTGDVRVAALKELVAALQNDLLALSSNSRLVYAPDSGHLIQINDSVLLAEEIRRMYVSEN